MGPNSEEDPFIMGVFYNLTCPSKWVLFQTFNTHIRVENVQVAPPGLQQSSWASCRPPVLPAAS